MVAICASVNIVDPWASVVIGLVAGGVYMGWSKLMLYKFKLVSLTLKRVGVLSMCSVRFLIDLNFAATRMKDDPVDAGKGFFPLNILRFCEKCTDA
jgi:ammonia channel protein AmtB